MVRIRFERAARTPDSPAVFGLIRLVAGLTDFGGIGLKRGEEGKRVEGEVVRNENGRTRSRTLTSASPLPLYVPPERMSHICVHCRRSFKRAQGVASHISQSPYCLKRENELVAQLMQDAPPPPPLDDFESYEPDPDPDAVDDPALDDALYDMYVATHAASSRDRPPSPMPPPPPSGNPKPVPRATAPTSDIVVDQFKGAANVVRVEESIAKEWSARRTPTDDNPYYPFKSKLDWEVGRWAKEEGPSASALDRLLQFEGVSTFCLVVTIHADFSVACRTTQLVVQVES